MIKVYKYCLVCLHLNSVCVLLNIKQKIDEPKKNTHLMKESFM